MVDDRAARGRPIAGGRLAPAGRTARLATRLATSLAVISLAVISLAGLAGAATASAAQFTVNDTADAPLSNAAATSCESTHESSCTLRAAVQSADNSGGASTITVPAGEYALSVPSSSANNPANGDLDINGSSTSLTIDGAGSGETIINADRRDRAFTVQSGESLSISGVTVENGDTEPGGHSSESGYGGAILNHGTLTVTGCTLVDSEAFAAGGAISSTGLAVSVTDSTIEGNTARASGGGAIAVYDGPLTLTGDTIASNKTTTGGKGGALFDREHVPQPVDVIDCTVSGNKAGLFGGAFFLRADAAAESGRLTIAGSTFEEDSTEHSGGAVYDENFGPIDVEDSRFLKDVSVGWGGAIDVEASGPLSVSESTFGEDESSRHGGAIATVYADAAVSRSTFVGNSASEEGGAIFSGYDAGLSLVNDTLEANHATRGGALSMESFGEPPPELVLLNDTIARNFAEQGGGLAPAGESGYPYLQIENTIVAANSGGDCYGAGSTDNTTTADVGGNIDSDGSCFSDLIKGDRVGVDPLLAPLGSQGGPTETAALLTGSPAIDDGVGSPLACPATDQRGVQRTGGCDVGAYQSVNVPPVEAPTAGSGSGSTTTTAAVQQPRRSARSETIHWKVARRVALRRILVTVDGRLYRTLGGRARAVTVNMVGRATGTVHVVVVGIRSNGARYTTTRTFHLCVPGNGSHAKPASSYLRPA
jgi:predicted outer membrane repeat protein